MTENTYKGWKLYDKVTIVIDTKRSMGYVCEFGNTEQLDSAKYWADPVGYRKNNLTCSIIDTNNNGFRLEIVSSADGSSQGGKLSFWTCHITKESENISFYVGINSDYLCSLIKHSTFVNGVCDKLVSFARCKGNVGALHEGMPEYQEAVSDNEFSTMIIKMPKTTKWKVGKHYRSKTTDTILLGYVYEFYEMLDNEEESYSRYGNRYSRIKHFHKLSSPVKLGVIATYKNGANLDYYMKHSYLQFVSKFPARVECEDAPIDTEAFETSMNEYLADRKTRLQSWSSIDYLMDYFFLSTSIENPPVVSEELLNSLGTCYHYVEDKT